MGENNIDEEELMRIVRDYKTKVFDDELPEKNNENFLSLDYKTFKTEEKGAKKNLGKYEKLCAISAKILKVEPSTGSAELLRNEIDFTNLQCTPAGVTSASFLSTIVLLFVSFAFILTGTVPIFLGLTMLVFSVIAGGYIYRYPSNR